MADDPEFLLYPLDTGENPVCPNCGAVMMVAGQEVRDAEPNFIIFRCKSCGRSEKYISDHE